MDRETDLEAAALQQYWISLIYEINRAKLISCGIILLDSNGLLLMARLTGRFSD